jgi:tetratricopeptide (TPR) repeat protein
MTSDGVTKRDTERAVAWYILGQGLAAEGNLQRARESYERALNLTESESLQASIKQALGELQEGASQLVTSDVRANARSIRLDHSPFPGESSESLQVLNPGMGRRTLGRPARALALLFFVCLYILFFYNQGRIYTLIPTCEEFENQIMLSQSVSREEARSTIGYGNSRSQAEGGGPICREDRVDVLVKPGIQETAIVLVQVEGELVRKEEELEERETRLRNREQEIEALEEDANRSVEVARQLDEEALRVISDSWLAAQKESERSSQRTFQWSIVLAIVISIAQLVLGWYLAQVVTIEDLKRLFRRDH